MDLLFAGLVQNLGPENVYDYPAHEKHRRGIPAKTGDPEKDWGAERGSLCYHHRNHELPVLCAPEVTQKLLSGFFDLVITDERVQSFKKYVEVKGPISNTPVVVVAGNDQFQTAGGPEAVRFLYGRNLKLMFLDNWRPEYDQLPYARPYSWSLNFDHLWDRNRFCENLTEKKVFDICFMGLTVSPHRREIIDHVQKRWGHLNNYIVDERQNGRFDKFLLKQEFFERMAQSRICLNLRGDAECGKALRFYEIPYVGSYMLSQQFVNPDQPSFVDHRHCHFFESLDELDTCVDWALRAPAAREQVARQGHEFVMRYHTCEQRAARMLDVIRDMK